MATKIIAKAKQRKGQESEDLSYEIEQLFGKNRKLQPGERNLISLFFNNMSGRLQPPAKGNRWVMFMALDMSTYTVIEQAAVSSGWSDEQWRDFFRWMYVDSFVSTPRDVARKAFKDYVGGERNINKLCHRYDNLYPHLDMDGQKKTRTEVAKQLSRMRLKMEDEAVQKGSVTKVRKVTAKKSR